MVPFDKTIQDLQFLLDWNEGEESIVQWDS